MVIPSYTEKISHRSIHIHTDKKRKREKKYISLLPRSASSIWDDSLFIQVFHRCMVRQVDSGDLFCCS